jgi:hypothetical protein
MLCINMKKVGIMVDFFLNLPKEQQSALLKQSAPRTNMRPFVLEKDIWVCWALQQLFTIPEPHPMAFKGGTSLSKVYQVIDRFSEDLDVTLDYRGFIEAVKGNESRSEIMRLSDKLKSFLLEYTRDKIKPYFEKVMSEQFGKGAGRIDLSDNGEKLHIHYPSVFDNESTEYLFPSILLEFGGRNITEPNEERKVAPYISQVLPNYLFPEPTVTVLALQRTYWEKATLIHVECHRPNERPETSRLSRHWYDLYQMSNNLSDFQSPDAHKVLRDVVRYKKVFFHYSYANYDLCLSGGVKLVPTGKLKIALEADFKSMIDVGMFYNEPPSFQKILDRLTQVEQILNESINIHNH